jgi:integrase
MWPDGDRGGWVVVNPINGRKKRFRASQEAAARELAGLLNTFLDNERRRKLLDAGKPTLEGVIDRWIAEQLHLQPWDKSTKATALMRLARIKRELGADGALIEDIGVVQLGDWLERTAAKADPFNKWRQILVLVWGFAVLKGLAKANEAEKVPRRSTSKKISGNRKVRQPLDVEGFRDIHAHGGPLLQLAMEMSLVTTLARTELCALQHPHFRDGWVFVIRDKVAADSEMGFVRIRITPQLLEFQERARRLDNIVCPFLLHRRPDRMQRRFIDCKEHWAQLMPDYLTRLFNEACAKVPRYAQLEPGQRPTLHEVRGLSARLLKAKGMGKEDIRALMTHADEKTTRIYLEGGRAALTDEHFVKVAAPFTVAELLL